MSILDRIYTQYWVNYAINLILRISGNGFRFLIPVTIIALGSPNELGFYYLAISIMAAISIFGGMELGLFYSIECKNKADLRSSAPMQQFFYVLCGFNLILSIAAIAFGIFWWKQLPELFVLIVLALAVESVSYEVGRFLWNLGEVEKVSRRDFLRPLVFLLSILISIFLYNKILTSVSLLIFIVGNTAILIYESRKYLGFRMISYNQSWVDDVIVYDFLAKFIRRVGPQFLQNQLLSVIVILERFMITVTIGVVFLGSYAFLFSIVSTLSHLIYMPKMVKVRKLIIADQLSLSNVEVYIESIKFLLPVIVVTFFITVAMFITGPLIENYFDKDLNFSPMIVATIGVTSAIYAYNAAVSPLFSHKTRWRVANMLTLFGLTPMLAAIYLHEFISTDLEMLALGALSISAIMQLVFRLVFFNSRVKALSN